MKKNKFNKKISTAVGSLILLFFLSMSVASMNTIDADLRDWKKGSRVFEGVLDYELDYNQLPDRNTASLKCKSVDNRTSEAIFVPTRTSGEWAGFTGFADDPNPGGVFVDECKLNGACGTANGTNILNYPGTYAESCSAGTDIIEDSTAEFPGDLVYNWRCDGLHGGTNATCSANRIINGSCGSAHNTIVGSAPSGGSLCNAGTATAVSGPGGSDTYTWSCTGENTGTDASCSATHQSTGPYTLGDWGSCSTTCGTGTRTRTVTCDYDTCTGESNTSEACTRGDSVCGWGPYGSYGSCNTSCGNGTKYQTRTCTTGSPGSAHCAGSDTRGTSCSAGSSTCGWGGYGSWGACSNSCGSGTQYRYRSCNVSGYCSGSNSQSQSCSSTAGCANCTISRPHQWSAQSGPAQTASQNCRENGGGSLTISHGATRNFSSATCSQNSDRFNCVGNTSLYCNNGSIQETIHSCEVTAGEIY